MGGPTRGQSTDDKATPQAVPARRRWLARAAWAALAAAIIVVLAAEGLTGLTLTVVGLGGAVLALAGGYWFIPKRGARRWVGMAAAAAAVVAVLIVYFGRVSRSAGPGCRAG